MQDDEGIVVGVVNFGALYLGQRIVKVEWVEIICAAQQIYLGLAGVDDVNPGDSRVGDRVYVQAARRPGDGPRWAGARLRRCGHRYRRLYRGKAARSSAVA